MSDSFSRQVLLDGAHVRHLQAQPNWMPKNPKTHVSQICPKSLVVVFAWEGIIRLCGRAGTRRHFIIPNWSKQAISGPDNEIAFSLLVPAPAG